MRDDWLDDIENAPKDGSDVLFPIAFIGRAYWDAELNRWVLVYPVHMDYVFAPTRYQLPKAQHTALSTSNQTEPKP